jgi:type IV pilus assembly protein PilA
MFKKLGSKLKEQKGFTLIELLAVIVILGIIAAIAIPAIGNVINKSDKKAAAQEGVQIINAAKLYVANNNVNATTEVTLTETEVGEYLDHAEDGDFTVKVTKVGSAGKYTYKLEDHTVNTADYEGKTTLTESELISAAK